MKELKTLGELKKSGHPVLSVREEMRKNLMQYLQSGSRILPGIIGYDDTVIPEIENAVLSGHHMVFLGERGQAKSRIIRGLVSLLDERIPIVQGCEINDNPLHPICRVCRRRLEKEGDALPIEWIGREQRYSEKLATPDASIADLIGEIDPIKVAEGRYLADEETIHYGLIPRTNRGIFAINELPDLTEKVQVGLFNLMEEKDVQIKGYKIRLLLDVMIVASANPEDYTSRGRIITPLKDRFDVQIRTHYPRTIQDEITIMEQEAISLNERSLTVRTPQFMKEIIANVTFEARRSNEINQASGVSVRVTINNYESMISNAEKRALRLREGEVVPRVSDLHCLIASTSGKIEMEYVGEDRKEDEVVQKLLNRALVKVFDQYFSVSSLQKIVDYFNSGWGVEVSDGMPAKDYLEGIKEIPGLKEAIRTLGPMESPALMASATEFIMEGLHLHQKLNKEVEGGRITYGK
ncbi:MAG: magnesium chelatase [Deltaproteobacteria bacterium RIFCSPLOWO2_02_FULL_57_26]|nr:MAG: magnesium chelatase [Deltaproteobacteria bacterium RIFCSPLOWO2_02_FULL_57_26]OGQ75171.1 MAG: magnesium chelatase [Deltaproteobacteria bacterium RIFCSPLOWO2_12_FULL_57_22]